MIFHNHNIPLIEQINSDSGRKYATPEGNLYPSVTTVLSIISSAGLDEWRKSVGHEEAARIGRRAAAKGTKVHSACENLINNIPTSWGMFEQDAKRSFEMFLPVLNSVSEIHAMETRLWSDKLETAGTVDLICKLDGKLVILDWKTSRTYKSREDISNYFMQLSFYAFSFWERTGVLVPELCVQMASDEVGLITYTEKTVNWVHRFNEIRQKYRSLKGS